jgi:ABC-2 type transport system ATP-binding protein
MPARGAPSLAVDIEGLVVQYSGSKDNALDGLTLKIQSGQFFGLLGPNGAGKTTLIAFICGQVAGRFHRAQILGEARGQAAKTRIGYAPQEIALYPTLSVLENLKFFARLLHVSSAEVERVLKWVGLEDRRRVPVEKLSGGLKRRLNLGVALLNTPDLLILDEPTVGVDPESRQFIFDKILELKAGGMTLIYSTHYLEEVERLCDHAAIVQAGRVLVGGRLDEILGGSRAEAKYLEWTRGAIVE